MRLDVEEDKLVAVAETEEEEEALNSPDSRRPAAAVGE